MKPTALIVDDEADIRELVEITLTRMNLRTEAAATLEQARALLDQQPFDLCLTDMRLPDGNGIELVRHIATNHPNCPVAVITAYGNVEAAVASLKGGAFDFVSKPLDIKCLRQLTEQALRLAPSMPDPEAAPPATTPRLLGETPVMCALRATIAKLARSQAPVYITGESGTGKELVARTIHGRSPRADMPFVPVNCGAIPSELMESEFFGHAKGAFTGAVQDKAGLFVSAHGGSLFLDEVAELPLAMQVKLLRAIQERAIRPLGREREIDVDVRIICATHQNLDLAVADGRFREDLYYRLNVIEIDVPSLRERIADIPIITDRILDGLKQRLGLAQKPVLTAAAHATLADHHFPGNVRELENILERAVALCDGPEIGPEYLRLQSPPGSNAASPVSAPRDADAGERDDQKRPTRGQEDRLESHLETIERTSILEALEATRYNKTQAAKRLGITFRALRYRLKKYGIE